jgi:putative hydrolase of the HAD superfamily
LTGLTDLFPSAGSRLGLRAVLFDAGNTLLFLDYARIAQGVTEALGLPLTADGLARHGPAAAQTMEQVGGTDRDRATAYLDALFRLSGVPVARLGEVRDCLAGLHRAKHLWCSVQERSREALDRLRSAGYRLGVVSNSDGKVAQALEAAGLRECFDVIIDSTLIGVEKPDPRIFQAALEALEVKPEETLYVGDLYEVDIVGARSAGLHAALMVRPGAEGREGCPTVESLEQLVNELLPAEGSLSPAAGSGRADA